MLVCDENSSALYCPGSVAASVDAAGAVATWAVERRAWRLRIILTSNVSQPGRQKSASINLAVVAMSLLVVWGSSSEQDGKQARLIIRGK